MLRKSQREHCSKISCSTYLKVEDRLKRALGEEPKTPTNLMAIVNQIMHPSQKELFFTPITVIVEGSEDVAFISSHLQLSDKWKQFRGFGCHFIVAGGKCNVSRFVAIAQELGISVFVVFDGDGDEENATEIEKHRRDNACILNLCGLDDNDSIPKKTVWADNLVMWETNIGDKVREDIGEDVWLKSEMKVREELMLHGGIKQKNTILITATLEDLWEQSKQSASLIKLCGTILRYAEKMRI